MLSQDILYILLQHPNEFLSGQELARQAGVSRNAVWKAVNQLRKAGYQVEASTNQGYRLTSLTQNLSQVQLEFQLKDSYPHLAVSVKDQLDSTSTQLKNWLDNHPGQNLLLAASKQTAGRGRRGRRFYSDLDHGLYFSFSIRPKHTHPDQLSLYTVLTAAALVDALEPYLSQDLQIKWVNDLFYQGKKAGGILCETASSLEVADQPVLVIGIGLNLAGSLAPADSDIQNVAGTFFGEDLPQDFNTNTFIREFLDAFAAYETSFAQRTFLTTYRQHLLGLGQRVSYIYNGQKQSGVILGLDDQARLIIAKDDGQQQTLVGQEIHLDSRQFTRPDRNSR